MRVESLPQRIFRTWAAPLIAFGVMILALPGCTLRTPPAGGWTTSTNSGKADTLATATHQTRIHGDTAKTVMTKPATVAKPAAAEKQAAPDKPTATATPTTVAKPAVAEQQTAPEKPSNKAMPVTVAKPAPVQNRTTAENPSGEAKPTTTVKPATVETQPVVRRQSPAETPAAAQKPAAGPEPAATKKPVVAEKQTTAATQSSAPASPAGTRGPHNPFIHLKRQQPLAGADSAVRDSSNSALPSRQAGMDSARDTTGTADRTQNQPAQAPTSTTAIGNQPGGE